MSAGPFGQRLITMPAKPFRPRLSRARIVSLGVLCAALVALVCAGCGGSSTALTASVSPGSGGSLGTVTVPATSVSGTSTSTVNSTTVTGPTTTTPAFARANIAVGRDAAVAPTSSTQGFLGLATEITNITKLSGTPTDLDTPFVHLLKNLSEGAPFLLRLGGDSADWSWWAVPGMAKPAAIRYTITPQWGEDVKALITAVGGKALLGVNLELDSKKVAAYEAQEYDKYIGTNLIDALELGNEPELYDSFNYYRNAADVGIKGRAPGYTIADYGQDFSTIASGLGDNPIAGPSSGSAHWLPELKTMLDDLPSRLKVVTVHEYPLKHCAASTHVTISDLFEPASIEGLANFVHGLVTAAAAHGKPVRLDEINGISCGGVAGVSNSFGEALWALNMLPALWKSGVEGVNWQDITGNLNQVITASQSPAGWSVSVQPEYYGLLAFAQVAPAGARMLKLNDPGYPGFYQYAVKDPNGAQRVVLTNIASGARSVDVSLVGAKGTGVISLLTAPSLGATGQTTLGGQRVSASTGDLAGSTAATLVKPNAKGVYAVRVPAHAAAILTVGS